MKIMLSVFIFLISVSSAAQSNSYPDGSYYNDDYIRDEVITPELPPQAKPIVIKIPQNPCRGVAVGEPSPNGDRCRPSKFPRPPKKRKPASLFQEVNTSKNVGDFKEVGSGAEESRSSPGSK